MYILAGTLGSFGAGASLQVFAIIFAEVLTDLVEPDPLERARKVNMWCLVFVGLAIGVGISNYFKVAFLILSFSPPSLPLTFAYTLLFRWPCSEFLVKSSPTDFG